MKILCIIQARMGSERLPGKVMKEIMGQPMIGYTVQRASTSKYINQIVVATSDKESDKPLVEYLKSQSIHIFTGDERNVLKRYVDAAEQYGGEVIIRLTGDCPLIDPVIIDQAVTYFLSNFYDYVRLDVPDTFIRGFDVEVFSRNAMKQVFELTETLDDNSPYKEHVTLYMYQHPDEFRVGVVKGGDLYNRNYRLCVDTKEDFELVCSVYSQFKDRYVSGKEIVAYLDRNPEIATINQEIMQKHV